MKRQLSFLSTQISEVQGYQRRSPQMSIPQSSWGFSTSPVPASSERSVPSSNGKGMLQQGPNVMFAHHARSNSPSNPQGTNIPPGRSSSVTLVVPDDNAIQHSVFPPHHNTSSSDVRGNVTNITVKNVFNVSGTGNCVYM